jgi:hypothetical protein
MKMRHAIVSVGFFVVSLSVCGFAAPGLAQERAVVLPASPAEARQQAAVFTFLQEYFSALAKGEVEQLATYHPSLTPEQLGILRDYFAHTIRDLHIRLQDALVIEVRFLSRACDPTVHYSLQLPPCKCDLTTT